MNNTLNVQHKAMQLNKKFKIMLIPHKLLNFLWIIARAVILLGISYYILYPLIIKVSLAFMHKNDMYDVSVLLVPKNFTLENIKIVWQNMQYPSSAALSLLLAVIISALQLASCTIVGYGFARFEFKGKGILFSMVILTLLVPPQTYIIPLFLQYRFFDFLELATIFTGQKGINLLDTFWPFTINALTCMGLKNGLYIYMIRQFFRNMPKELEEASLIDGAGAFRTFLYVMAPSAVPIMLTVGLFSFVWQWNDYFYMGWFSPTMKTLPKALEQLVSSYMASLHADTGILTFNPSDLVDPRYALMLNSIGSLFVILPPILMYMFLQKYFVQSIERSGIVG